MTTATACHCGSDLTPGPVETVFCPHCDRGCVVLGCELCATLRLTCNDCRRVHATEARRGTCEESHRFSP